MAGGLQAQPLITGRGFNWVFLIEIAVCVILALFFLFYFNRLFATVISYGIRAFTWHKYRTYIDITALQISPLGGRLFFKRITYHGHNITVYVYDGHVTWRYWLRAVREAEAFIAKADNLDQQAKRTGSSSSEQDEKEEKRAETDSGLGALHGAEEAGKAKSKKDLPCRISVQVSGVEVFIYNRSPLYDGIVEATVKRAAKARADDPSKPTPVSPFDEDAPVNAGNNDGDKFGFPAEKTTTAETETSAISFAESAIPVFFRVFPIHLQCKRAAAAIGNEHTKNVLTAKVERSSGTVDVGHAGPLDLCRLIMDFAFEDIDVAMRPNPDFKELQLSAAERALRRNELEPDEPHRPVRELLAGLARRLRAIWSSLSMKKKAEGSLRAPSLRQDPKLDRADAFTQSADETEWHGLMRYLDDNETHNHEEWQSIEYAKASQLVECDKVTMHFFYDLPGRAPKAYETNNALQVDPLYNDDVNGSKPPAYALDLGVYGGIVVYGPWADRQRLNLQQIFFPTAYVDAQPAERLKPGEYRVYSIFKISVIVEEDVILRIPTREESKDHEWAGRAQATAAPDTSRQSETHQPGKKRKHNRRRKDKAGGPPTDARPYAWLDITVKKDSVVNYTMDMFPRDDGYRSTLDLDVKGIEMTSSVNHGLLWRSGALALDADLSYPLAWNSLRKWPFKIICNDLELFILRDHLFLIIDLVNDWASGAAPEFFTFVPFAYELDLTFKNFCMYLNVNDANIINEPASFEKNDFLTLEGQLHANLDIPMINYRPARNQISFSVLAQEMRMRMLSPIKSTFHDFLHDKVVATLPRLTLDGSFNANQENRVGLTDVLRFDIVGSGLTLFAYGFLVRQLVNIKENYFGDYLHFKTLEEFQGASADLDEANAKTATTIKPARQNEMDVILVIVAEDAAVVLPTNIYSADQFIRIELPRADLDLRINSYYLDMGLNLSPLSFLAGAIPKDDDSGGKHESETQFYVAHVDLYGHRTFGLPPNEDAYVSQWDIDVGKITGELSDPFIHDLALAGRAFAFTISDAENALPVDNPVTIFDATFVQVQTDTLQLWMHAGPDALLLSADPVRVEVNDWSSETFSQRITVVAPALTVACVDGRSASRHRTRSQRKDLVRTYAILQTGVTVDVVGRKRNFEEETQKQQRHILLNDQRTSRAQFLRRPRIRPLHEDDDLDFDPPAMPYPPLPAPITSNRILTDRPASIKSNDSFARKQNRLKSPSASSLSSSIRSSQAATPMERPPLNARASSSMTGATIKSNASSLQRGMSGWGRPLSANAMPSDHERATFGLPASTMAFASPYSEPYFPLQMVEPDSGKLPTLPTISSSINDDGSDRSSISGAINNPDTTSDAEQITVFINVASGVRAYVEPRMGVVAATIIEKILPRSANEVMDAFHMDVMGLISSHQAEKHGKPQTLEINASLPIAAVRVVNLDKKGDVRDLVDLEIQPLAALVRVKTQPSEQGATQILALQSTVSGLTMKLMDINNKSGVPPAITLLIEDVLCWLAFTSTNAFHISFRSTNLAINGPQTTYLIYLALRLLPIISEIKTRIDGVLSKHEKRRKLLVHTLTRHCEDANDPSFMLRMEYILRAFPDHYRNQDSWKIVSRIRKVLQNLPQNVLNELNQAITDGSAQPYAADTQAKDVATWMQWRNWDVPFINQTTAFKTLFSPQKIDGAMDKSTIKAATVTFRSEFVRVAIEEEARASEFILRETSVGVENLPPTTPQGLMLVEENTRTKTIVQLHTESIDLAVDWTLFKIVETVLPMKDEFEELAAPLQAKDSRSPTQAIEDGFLKHETSVVFSTEQGTIKVRSINLRHSVQANGLKLSVIGTTAASNELGQCVSAILNVNEAITELYSADEHHLWHTTLTSPSLYIDQLHPAKNVDAPSDIMIAVAYEELAIIIKEQVPGMLHVVDSIIVDEVATVQRLVDAVAEGETVIPQIVTDDLVITASRTSKPTPPAKFNVAVLAGRIYLEASLLQELYYKMRGTAAGVRVAPDRLRKGVFSIDFDIGQLHHAFVNTSDGAIVEREIVQVPPINGHVGLELTDESHMVTVATTISQIEVDARTLSSVIAVVNEPEVQKVIDAIKSGVDDIKAHIADIFPPEGKTNLSPIVNNKVEQSILYDIRFALLGLRFSARAPGAVKHTTSEVEFGIGPVHVKASNRETYSDRNPLLPEIRAQVRDIGARMFVSQSGKRQACGRALLGIDMHFNVIDEGELNIVRVLKIQSARPEINACPETASAVVDIINHLQDAIKRLDVSKEIDYLRRIKASKRSAVMSKISGRGTSNIADAELPFSPEDLLSIRTTIEIDDIQAAWLVDQSFAVRPRARVEDLVFSIRKIELITRGGHEARLTISDMQLQLAKTDESRGGRALNSALLPEIGFTAGYWSENKQRKLAFKATGRPLDIQLESRFMLPVNAVQRSIENAIDRFKQGTATWQSTPTTSGAPRAKFPEMKHLNSVLVEADFAGAQVHIQGSGPRRGTSSSIAAAFQQQQQHHHPQHGRYGQFAADGAPMEITLTAPGIAFKLEYNSDQPQPVINAELRIDASSNSLAPNVVPLVLEISQGIKEVMQASDQKPSPPETFKAAADAKASQKLFEEESIITANPAAIFGKTKVNVGFRICKQEFGLSCQPIAKVDAQACLEDFYFTINTIDSEEYGHFFAVSAVVTGLTAQVKHVYSREPTFSYHTDSIVLSAMNNKHLSGTPGISAILNINPTQISINGKQFQDLLLFREIWFPPEIRSAAPAQTPAVQAAASRPEEFLVQKYQSVAAAAAFPWNATVSIAKLTVDVDLGQSIGKSTFSMTRLWASQQKSSNYEQNLCIGLDEMAVNSTGRMSGFIQLGELSIRMSIKWPDPQAEDVRKTPLIQASIGFQRLRAKAAFDYQAFAFGDIEDFDFLMYNVRDTAPVSPDRLVAVLDCQKAYVFCTSTSSAHAVGLYQAFDRLVQDKQAAYIQSLRDIEKFVRRESTIVPTKFGPEAVASPVSPIKEKDTPIRLHTDVVVTIGAISLGVYPTTFFDSQMLKAEANNIQARFAAGLERGRITSGLGMTLGQLQVALSAVRRMTAVPKALEISIDDVISNAINAKGGTILRVPKVIASMQTWQSAHSNHVDYIFKSLFEGKIDVGWNLSRINFIKGMWNTHSRALASRIGKSLPQPAVKITAAPQIDADGESKDQSGAQEKITAEINLPQSRYEYKALVPPVIETPQLRDMGEATPPLEWIGLNREKLPNVTHQIIIVSLLEVCKEVEDAYERILGSS